MASDDPVALAKKAASDARKMMVLTMFAVAVAILVLAIDNTIKRAIVDEAQKMRGLYDKFEAVANGIEAARQDGTGDLPPDGAADSPSGGVADDSGARAAANGDAGGRKPAGTGRGRGRPAGARGDGV